MQINREKADAVVDDFDYIFQMDSARSFCLFLLLARHLI